MGHDGADLSTYRHMKKDEDDTFALHISRDFSECGNQIFPRAIDAYLILHLEEFYEDH